MAYIGTIPAEAYTSFAVQHFTTSATDTFTLDFPVANENEIALFINNVRQEPGSSYAYTASGTTLTLSSAITGSDSMYCVFIGKAVQTVTPASGSVTNDMLAGSIANAKLANSSITLNGSAVSLGGSANAGITEADQWRLTTSFTSDATPISANLERNDSSGFGVLGTGMSVSSGNWTFPSTGYWWVSFNYMLAQTSGDETDGNAQIYVTIDNSTYNLFSGSKFALSSTNMPSRFSSSTQGIIDVTDTSLVKVQFQINAITANTQVNGDTNRNDTFFTFIRLGDT